MTNIFINQWEAASVDVEYLVELLSQSGRIYLLTNEKLPLLRLNIW